MQDINPNQLKLKVNDSSEKDEKTTTHFETSHDEDVLKKSLSRYEFIKNRGSDLIYGKRLQRIQITQQQLICRRGFDCKSSQNHHIII